MRRALLAFLIAATLASALPAATAFAQQSDVVSTLPQRTPPPRTLQDYWPVFAGLSISWVAIMGYYLSMSGRAGRISEGIARSQESDAP